MKKINYMALCAAILGVTLLAPGSAEAGYLNPGSGSTAVQWIIAAIASLGKMRRRVVGVFSRSNGN